MNGIQMRNLLLCLLFVLILPGLSVAETKIFVKEYRYQASDLDSKVSSRAIALEQVKRLLLEELGTYLESETEARNFQLTRDQIRAYSAGIISTEILQEKWDGVTFYLKARMSADPAEVVKALRSLIYNRNEASQMEDVRRHALELSKQIEDLKKELAQTKADMQGLARYNQAVNQLSAGDWYERGLTFGRAGNTQGALEAHSKAIELNPRYKEAYSMRALIYNRLGDNEQATLNFQSAARLGDERAQKLLKMKGLSW
jgi:tetratricopeptide (TPR) repeat protein